ncbi:D-2-hydroxyglutarate dehydrogenase, mitochondrial-like [Centruroides sculpturatus]|uniref:D-2-hydroxyglutarate dehydrogenase, mitochondrial-like n=1 Tax=Centruroides sculpturatus TaxID=218467 RepID=UPI000C6E1AEA|nr:D-2-hydroxyglutarate dehydrogenase, mitochondrial-like [Centruroides sculpturatus]
MEVCIRAVRFKSGLIKNVIDYNIRRLSNVELTSLRYPNIKRKTYSKISTSHLENFGKFLGDEGMITSGSDLESYNTDWMKTCRGQSTLLLRPKSTEEVSKILSYCHKENLAVCPQGGNTGLVGGSVPVFDEIILSTVRMKKIWKFDELSGIMICDAGCVLETLESFANEIGFTVPLDLGAKGSCHIGGNIATNAGGLRLIRYGSLTGNVLGLEVVLADGRILDCLSTNRKDNTGYNLRQIFIGSEGTLGIITKAAILCVVKPSNVAISFLGCSSFNDILKLFKLSKSMLCEVVSSFEMMDHHALDAVEKHLKLRLPISHHPFYALVEVSGSNEEHNKEKLSAWLECGMEKNLIKDGTMVTEPGRIQNVWGIRERITEALLHEGYTYKYDISLPLNNYYEIVDIMRERLGSSILRCCGYGHIGDGNVHLNMTSTNYSSDILNQIEPFVYEWTAKHKGSISAEHGLGFKKRNYIKYSKSQNAINLMKNMKNLLDPKGILNPYKVLPDE